jgi:acyl carrier protein
MIDADQHFEEFAGVLRQVIGCPEVRPEDDFYLLGGHSLLIVQIVRLLRSRHGIELDIRAFAQNPQIAALAAACRAIP